MATEHDADFAPKFSQFQQLVELLISETDRGRDTASVVDGMLNTMTTMTPDQVAICNEWLGVEIARSKQAVVALAAAIAIYRQRAARGSGWSHRLRQLWRWLWEDN